MELGSLRISSDRCGSVQVFSPSPYSGLNGGGGEVPGDEEIGMGP